MLKIMIAVDGSPTSLNAVRHGIDLVGSGLQAQFVLAHAQHEASLFELATQDSDMIATASVEAGMHLMAEAEALVRAAGVSYEMEVGLGEPAATLADIADRTRCGLIIIGALGQGQRLRRSLLGSVSREIVRISAVPVTIVKPDDADLSREQDLSDEI